MALLSGDMFVPGGVFLSAAKVGQPLSGSVTPRGVVFGTWDTSNVKSYTSGLTNSNASADTLCRKVTAYTGGTNFLGQRVQWVGKSAGFSGVCTLQFNVELNDTFGVGNQEPVLEVRSDLGFFFLVRPADVEVV